MSLLSSIRIQVCAGSAGAAPLRGVAACRISLRDGLGFASTTSGGWLACAPGQVGFCSGGCKLFNLDGLGMLALVALRRRSAC